MEKYLNGSSPQAMKLRVESSKVYYKMLSHNLEVYYAQIAARMGDKAQ